MNAKDKKELEAYNFMCNEILRLPKRGRVALKYKMVQGIKDNANKRGHYTDKEKYALNQIYLFVFDNANRTGL